MKCLGNRVSSYHMAHESSLGRLPQWQNAVLGSLAEKVSPSVFRTKAGTEMEHSDYLEWQATLEFEPDEDMMTFSEFQEREEQRIRRYGWLYRAYFAARVRWFWVRHGRIAHWQELV